MIWALLGVGVVVAAAVIWLRRLAPDDPAEAAQSTGTASKQRSASNRSGASDTTRSTTRDSTRNSKRDNVQKRRAPFAAVSISPGDNACAVVQDMTNVRHLKNSAPRLPVEHCDAISCQCTFNHHEDRRQAEENDRRAGIGLKSELFGSSGERERRREHGRRASDRS